MGFVLGYDGAVLRLPFRWEIQTWDFTAAIPSPGVLWEGVLSPLPAGCSHWCCDDWAFWRNRWKQTWLKPSQCPERQILISSTFQPWSLSLGEQVWSCSPPTLLPTSDLHSYGAELGAEWIKTSLKMLRKQKNHPGLRDSKPGIQSRK